MADGGGGGGLGAGRNSGKTRCWGEGYDGEEDVLNRGDDSGEMSSGT